ncbi:subunit of tubulin prefoldin [Leucoagaricus gongylophorus]
MASPPPPQTIRVGDLDITQLADVKKQLDDELAHLASSFSQLRQAQAKFKACIHSITQIRPQNSHNTILVPLTNSLYVPGKLSDPDHVVVDVGTGYFVKKTRPQAVQYYNEKVDYLKSNLDSLEDVMGKKRENHSYIVSILQAKIQAQVEVDAPPTKS